MADRCDYRYAVSYKMLWLDELINDDIIRTSMTHAESSSQPEKPPHEAFFEAFDYPDSAEDQVAFDGIVQSALARLNPDLQRIFVVGADMIRWSLWPTNEPPLGIAPAEWSHYYNHGPDPSFDAEALLWTREVLGACDFDELEIAVIQKRHQKEPVIKEALRAYITNSTLVHHLQSFDVHGAPQERPLSPVERLSATAELRHSLLGQHGDARQLYDPSSSLSLAWRRGVYRIEDRTRTDIARANSDAYERLYQFVSRSYEAGKWGIDETHFSRKQILLESSSEDITSEFETVGFGTQALLDNRNELVASDFAWINAYIVHTMCRASLEGKPYALALQDGITRAVEEYYGDVVRMTRYNAYPYGMLLRLTNNVQPNTIPPGSLPDVVIPEKAQDIFGEPTAEAPQGSLSVVPSKTRPKDHHASRYQRPSINFGPMPPDELFATRRTPTISPVARLLELAGAYRPLGSGPAHMVIETVHPLSAHTMPYVEGYELLKASVPQEGRYYFTKADGDAYKPLPVDISRRQQYELEKALESIGLVTAARTLGRTATLSLHGIAATLRETSIYIEDGSDFVQYNNLAGASLKELGRLVRNDRYCTRCDAASLLLDKVVSIVLPGATTRFVTGKMIPTIGSAIDAMDHVQLEVFDRGRLFRLDSTPSMRSAAPPADISTLTMEVDSPYGSAAPNLPQPAHKKTVAYTMTPEQRVNNVKDYAMEIARLVTDRSDDTVLERLMQYPDDNPLHATLRLFGTAQTIPGPADAQEVIAYCENFARADDNVLQRMGLDRYKPYREMFAELAKRITALYD